MTGLLASVKDPREARLAVAGGADLIDFKDPGYGALGALPAAAVVAGVEAVAGRRSVSATIGDPPMEARRLLESVREASGAGVDLVKVGLDGPPRAMRSAIAALGEAAEAGAPLVAVLFGDRAPDPAWIPPLARAGVRGVMVDTAGKDAGPLTDHLGLGELAGLVTVARGAGLLTGLAGSLGAADIPALLDLHPDFLGFRGALCGGAGRAAQLDPHALARIRALVPPEGG